MNDELHKAVTRHLNSQRDSAAALKLWDGLWDAYQRTGGDGVTEFIDQMIELPDTDEEERS